MITKKAKKSMFAIANDDLVQQKQVSLDDLDVRSAVNIANNSRPLNFRYSENKNLLKDNLYDKETVLEKIWGRMQMSSFFLFAKNNGFRRLCTYLNQNSIFNMIIVICIFVSSVLLIFDSPTMFKDDKFLKDSIGKADLVFTIVFVIEMIVKMVAQNVW